MSEWPGAYNIMQLGQWYLEVISMLLAALASPNEGFAIFIHFWPIIPYSNGVVGIQRSPPNMQAAYFVMEFVQHIICLFKLNTLQKRNRKTPLVDFVPHENVPSNLFAFSLSDSLFVVLLLRKLLDLLSPICILERWGGEAPHIRFGQDLSNYSRQLAFFFLACQFGQHILPGFILARHVPDIHLLKVVNQFCNLVEVLKKLIIFYLKFLIHFLDHQLWIRLTLHLFSA